VFSGIVERVGRIERRDETPGAGSVRLRVHAGFDADPAPGASVAVNGVCLTVERASNGAFDAVAVPETLGRTNLGDLRVGDRVNLERALRVGDEMGGHWVQGHVDGVAEVTGVEAVAGETRVTVRIPAPLARYVAEKGSVTLDGVSLTVAAWEAPAATLALVPYTLERTTASAWRPGARVNVEVDVVARYLDRLLAARARETEGATAPRTEAT
jgi:riboflavin synthase